MTALKYMVIWGLILVLAFFVIQSSSLRNLTSGLQTPKHSAALISQNEALFKKPSVENKQKIIENSYKILEASPLNTDALEHIALSKYESENSGRVIDIARAIKARDARRRSNLNRLVVKSLSISKLDETLDNLILLMRLDPKKTEAYDTTLDLIYDIPDGRKAIEARFDTAPAWIRRLLSRRIAQADKTNLDAIKDNIRDFSVHIEQNGGKNSTFIEAYITKYTKFGFIDEAHTFWENIYGLSRRNSDTKGRVFNPEFKDLEVASPFNWKFYNSKNSTYEMQAAGGVYMSFNTEKHTFLGRQFIFLDPDQSYVAKFSAEYRYQKRGRYFNIQAVCMKTGDVILNIPLKSDVRINSNVTVALRPVPEGCEAVDLQILGKSDSLQNRASINLKAFNIFLKDAVL